MDMGTVPNHLIGDAIANSGIWSTLESLTGIGNRMAGQRGESEGARYLEQKFEELGFSEIEHSEFPVPGWWRGDSKFTVNGDIERIFEHDHELIALPGSPSETVSGPIVDVGAGTPEEIDEADISGSLALVSIKTPDDYGRWVHRMEKYRRVVEEGAEGFLFYNEIPGCLPPTGNIGGDEPAEIPAVGLSQEVGKKLVRACNNGKPDGTLEVNAESGPSTSHTVEATIGPDTEQEILLTAHVDSHDITDGATDNGVGCALVTEVGRLLNRNVEKLETKVRLLIFGAEEIGLRGSQEWAKNHDSDQVKAIVNVDGNGTWEDITVYTHGFEGLTTAFKSIEEPLKPAMSVKEGYLPHSDHWPFVQRGIPGVMIRSESSTGRGWGHTHGDTLDKLSPKPLRELAIGISAGVIEIAKIELEIPHHSVGQVKQELIENGHKVGMKASGNWPYS